MDGPRGKWKLLADYYTSRHPFPSSGSDRGAFQSERGRDGGIRHLALMDIEPLPQRRVLGDGTLETLAGQLQHIRQRHVRQGVGAGAADRARHVGDAVVHHVIDDVTSAGCAWSAATFRRSRPGRWPRR